MENLSFPLFITWSITSKCNLRCKHCFRTEYDTEYINYHRIKDMVKLFKDNHVQGIILTGGEPLCSQYIFDILREINGEIKVGIATNGILLSEEMINKLLQYDVKTFQISLEGTNEIINDYIRGKGTFKKVLKSINLLKQKNCNITIAMTVNSHNYEDIKNNSLDFVKKLGINKLRLEYYIPIVNRDDQINTITDEMMTDLYANLIKNNDTDVKIQYPRFDDNIGCGAGIYNCVINSDFSISPCDLLTEKYRTTQIKNIEDFQNYWNHDKSFIEWRKKMNCYNCDKKYKCPAMENNYE